MSRITLQRIAIAGRSRLVALFRMTVVALFFVATNAAAQFVRGAPSGPSVPPRELAPEDLTGVWVSVVNEDWHHRMMPPVKGDYASVPLTPAGRALADQWDPVADIAAGNECRSYGAPGVTRMPGRMRISWEDDYTLKLEFDAGMQTRLLHFERPARPGAAAAPAMPGPAGTTLQGHSVARFAKQLQSRGFFGGPTGTAAPTPGTRAAIEVKTTNLSPGYLRKNGIPYSANTLLTEYLDRFDLPGGAPWLLLSTIVEDPQNLFQRFIVSSQFKKEPNDSNWNPRPCSAT
jgi:hypothetical protein